MSLYTDRIAQGLCGGCGEENKAGGSLCAGCKQKSKERAAAKRAKHRAAGGCLGCGKPLETGTRCEKCKAEAKVSRQKGIAKKKAAGICVQGGCHNPVKVGCTLCQEHIDKLSAVSSEHYRRRKEAGTCCFCKDPPLPDKTMCARHTEMYKDYRFQTRMEALNAYGGPVCVGCGNDNVDILEIDHIAGGGNEHRRDIGIASGGYSFYLWLKREGFPPGFRVLCPTCNKEAYRGTLALDQ
jgi:hypothetical protein